MLPMEDPVFEQMQQSIAKSGSNLASNLSSGAAFMSLKRREAFLQNAVPSLSEAQRRKLFLDSLFQVKDLFAESSIQEARSAARDVSLFQPHLQRRQSQQSTSSGRRSTAPHTSGFRGRGKSVTFASSSRRSPRRSPTRAQSTSKTFKKSSDPSKRKGGFRK